jgi:hypothetical protein
MSKISTEDLITSDAAHRQLGGYSGGMRQRGHCPGAAQRSAALDCGRTDRGLDQRNGCASPTCSRIYPASVVISTHIVSDRESTATGSPITRVT